MRCRPPAVACISILALVALSVVAPASSAAVTANDPLFAKQYGPQQIAAPQAWSRATGKGVIIAIVDTGVDLHHPDLAAKLVPGKDFVDGDDTPDDCAATTEHPGCGHGTHVAGIAAAITGNGQGIAGVAPDARIMPVRAVDPNGVAQSDAVIQGIHWAVDHGAKVVNLSLAGPVTLIDALFGNSLEDAIGYAWQHGALVVAAAGNTTAAGASQPSGYSHGVHALVVTATDRDRHHPNWANRADTAWSVAAPGDAIVSTLPGGKYGELSGTSMSAPHVAGLAALLFGQGLTASQVVDRIVSTAHRLGDPSVDGAGLVDAAAAVGANAATTAAMPSPTAGGPSAAPAIAPSPAPPTPRQSGPSAPSENTTPATSTLPLEFGSPNLAFPGAAPATPLPPGTVVGAAPTPQYVTGDQAAAPLDVASGRTSRAGVIGAAMLLLGFVLFGLLWSWRRA